MLDMNESQKKKLFNTCVKYFSNEAKKCIEKYSESKIPIIDHSNMKLNDMIMKRIFFKISMGKMFRDIIWNERVSKDEIHFIVEYLNSQIEIPICKFDSEGYFVKFINLIEGC